MFKAIIVSQNWVAVNAKIKREIRYTIAQFVSPLISVFDSKSRCNGFRLLIFHNVLKMQVDKFQQLIDVLEDEYSIIDPEDLFCPPSSFKTNKPQLAISFDDGFLSNSIVAEQVLDKKGIKAIFFVCPGFVGQSGQRAKQFVSSRLVEKDLVKNSDDSEYMPMTWEHIKNLSQKGHTIGSHTVNHPRLTDMNDINLMTEEIVLSGKIIADVLGKPVEWFAYPFGDIGSINRRSLSIIKTHYQFNCTSLRGVNTQDNQSFCLYRDSINLNDPLHYIQFILKGGLDWLYRPKMKAMQLMSAERRIN